ncbi:ankyrin repeat protein [Acanthamoeba polyphaga mimivirus]|uniref:Ankyrin repeat protein n=2 Tax=Megamimivirinae TaxID=3044648 RepID=A0A2L2DN78_MIMIV|nr:putative ankyrin repeat protein [Megavirus chiliensis]AEQ33150.1 ankyrin repeat protein [Megavirus chiliensis]AVG46517.1 ankyrin repeat protein [Acanthamoeba polyphaga mimivirus]AVG47629.1 ankyrin repeat protein [Acanthamoeba polyphaga mimivirus]
MSDFRISVDLLQKTITNKDTAAFIEILEKCGKDDYWSITNFCRLYDTDQSMINILINQVESGLIPISDYLTLAACNVDNVKLMDLLINSGANINMDNSGNNPGIVLMQACAHGNTKLVEYLLQKGMNPNCNDRIFIRACLNQNLNICKLLLDNGFIINYDNNKIMRNIIKLIRKKSIDTIKLLIDHGFDFALLNKYCESENTDKKQQTVQMLLDCGIEAKNLPIFF